MPKNFCSRIAQLLLLSLAFHTINSARGADVAFYGVIKGQTFFQSSSTVTAADGSSNTVFQALASPTKVNLVTNATVKAQLNPAIALSLTNGLFSLQRSFATITAMDQAFPNGDYTIKMQAVNDGIKSGILSLTGNSYPATPKFNNFTAAQAVNPATNFTLSWTLTGGTVIDYLQLMVLDCRSNLVFSTGSPGAAGALNGSSTSAVIPGRTLRAGHNYSALLLALRPIDIETNSYPGTFGVAGYYKQLRMPLITTGSAAGCPNGNFRLQFNFPDGNFVSGTNGSISFPKGISNYFGVFTIEDELLPAANVVFTGPTNSSLINTTNTAPVQLSGLTASYQTPAINTPSFPGAGIYTIQYKGMSNNFNLLNPNASAQQVILLPTVTVNTSNVLKKINWTYKTTSGITTNAQAYMHHIELRVDGYNGILYQAGNVSKGTNSHTVAQSVLWSDVKGIQLLFTDTPGNRYVSYWNRPVPTRPVLNTATYSGAGQFSFQLSGSPGQNYTLQTSSNLVNWVSLLITNSASGNIQIKHTAQTGSMGRYYRAVVTP